MKRNRVDENKIIEKSDTRKKKNKLKLNLPPTDVSEDQDTHNERLPEGLSILADTATTIEARQNKNRLGYLTTHMPTQLMDAFNTRDMNSLKLIIEDTFLTDCQLRTSAVPNEVTGRENVYRFFETYIQGCPDVVMEYITPMKFNIRVVSFLCLEQGTRSNFNVADELFDHLKYGIERAPDFLYEKNKYSYFRNTGRPVPFTTTSYVNFILNEAMTHVEKYIHTCKEVKVAEPVL